eukprot:1152740-Pelagomonas_calceolata.AAC.3
MCVRPCACASAVCKRLCLQGTIRGAVIPGHQLPCSALFLNGPDCQQAETHPLHNVLISELQMPSLAPSHRFGSRVLPATLQIPTSAFSFVAVWWSGLTALLSQCVSFP